MDVKQFEYSHIASGNEKWYSYFKKHVGSF